MTHKLLIGLIGLLILAACDNRPAVEYIHLPGTEPAAGANMPFTSAMKVNSGTVVFLSGITAAPVPHSHPHVPAEFDHVDFDAAAQTDQIMLRMAQTLKAAGGDITDVVQVTKFIVDVGENQNAITATMNKHFGEHHRPASTTIGIVRLATDPRFLVELEAVAVIQ
jgi:enamine deaminase RidA (YjgF/YER057c/UK114 family)